MIAAHCWESRFRFEESIMTDLLPNIKRSRRFSSISMNGWVPYLLHITAYLRVTNITNYCMIFRASLYLVLSGSKAHGFSALGTRVLWQRNWIFTWTVALCSMGIREHIELYRFSRLERNCSVCSVWNMIPQLSNSIVTFSESSRARRVRSMSNPSLASYNSYQVQIHYSVSCHQSCS